MKYIEGMRCPLCKSTKCILTDNEFDYKCLNCGHEAYWGREELEGRTPPKFSEEEDDEPPHITHAAAYLSLDPKYAHIKYIEDAEELVKKLRKTDYFGDADESFFVDDESAPPRGTEEYRQWYEYCMAKGWYNVIGESPCPEGYAENDDF